MHRTLQGVLGSAYFAFTEMLRSPSEFFDRALAPFVFAWIAAVLARDVVPDPASFAMAAAAALVLWDRGLFSVGRIASDERWFGTMMPSVLAGGTIARFVIGKAIGRMIAALIPLAMVESALAVVLGPPTALFRPALLIVGIGLMVVAYASLGLLAGALVLFAKSTFAYRNAVHQAANVFCGALFPITLLPRPMTWISIALAPTWSIELVRISTSGVEYMGYSAPECAAIALILSGLTIALAIAVFAWIERAGRRNGKLGYVR